MYKVTFYFPDGTEKVEFRNWRFLPDTRRIDSKEVVAFRVEKPTPEELRAAGY